MDYDVPRAARALRAVAVAIAAGALLVGLLWAGPEAGDVGRLFAAPQRYVDLAGPVEAALTVVGAVAWLLVAWLTIGTLLATAVVLPGAAGRIVAGVARFALPFGLRRLLAGVLGAGVLVAAAGCGTTGSMPTTRYVAADWPTAATAPAVDWPASDQPSSRPAPASTPRPVSQPTTEPSALDPAGSVTVVAGDTLWRIAAEHLPPAADDSAVSDAAAAWFAANQTVIGPDPDLIHPGLRLVPPGTTA